MTDKLAIYKLASLHLRVRTSSLSAQRETRRVFDDFWDHTVAVCLTNGLWNFMTRAVELAASESIVPAFGWSSAFTIPDDWVRTVVISTVETFIPPLLDYMEESGYWYSNWSPIFVRYISNDDAYGMDLSRWPPNFTDYVALQLAEYACNKVTGGDELLDGPNGISKRCYKARIRAKATDAMNQPPGQPPTGTWARSRRGFLRGLPQPGGSTYDD